MAKWIENDVNPYFSGLTERTAKAFGVDENQCHIGHLLLQAMRENPNLVQQIDAGIEEQQTNVYVADKSMELAQCMRRAGLKPGDIVMLAGPNTLSLCLPFYATFFNGAALMAIDFLLGDVDLKHFLSIGKPKMIFCPSEMLDKMSRALKAIGHEALVVTIDKSEQDLYNFVTKYGKSDLNNEENFNIPVIDSSTDALLVCTSGSTGIPKAAVMTYATVLISVPLWWYTAYEKLPIPGELELTMSYLQWISSVIIYLCSPILRFTRLQTSKPYTEEHCIDMINKYKPQYLFSTPPRMTLLLNYEKECDFSCFKEITVGGSAVSKDLVEALRGKSNAWLHPVYGMTELCACALKPNRLSPLPSPGRPYSRLEYRMVDPATGKDVTKPNEKGELWLKGEDIFKGYLDMPEETEKAFSEDGWFRTGDLFYRDENDNYFFVERLKLLLKYRNYQISPVMIEDLISKLPGVLQVVVTGIPSERDGELVTAMIVRRPGHTPPVTADDVKNVVKDNLAESCQLRGGVAFVESLPMNPNGKVERPKVRALALTVAMS